MPTATLEREAVSQTANHWLAQVTNSWTDVLTPADDQILVAARNLLITLPARGRNHDTIMNAIDQTELIKLRMGAYLAEITDVIKNGQYADQYPEQPITAETGQRYWKVILTWGAQRMVHSFVEITTGDVFKAEGWSRPAKGVRYRLADDESFAELLRNVDAHGAYLYRR